MARIASLTGTLTLDNSQFDARLNASRRLMDSSATSFNRGLGSIERGFKGLGGTVASVLGGISLAKLAKDVFDAGLRFDQLNTKLTFATGSAAGAAREYEYLQKFTNALGLSFSATANAFANFNAAAKGTSIEGESARKVFEAVAKASAALKLSSDDTTGVFIALGQIISKGTVQAEELRGQLGERLPGAFQIAARAMGVTTAKLGDMLKKGEVISADFLPKFAVEMEKAFGQAAVDAADSATSSVNRLSNAWEQLLITMSSSDLTKRATENIAAILNALNNLWQRAESGGEKRQSFVDLQAMESDLDGLKKLQEQKKQQFANNDMVIPSLRYSKDEFDKDMADLDQQIATTESKLKAARDRFAKALNPADKGEMGRRGLLPVSPLSTGKVDEPLAKKGPKSQAQKDEEEAAKMIADLERQLGDIGKTPIDTKVSEALAKIGQASAESKTQVAELIRELQRATLSDEEFARVQAADAEAVAKWTAEMEKGKSVAEALRSPIEIYRDRVAELNKLHADGAIDGVTWARGLDQAKGTLEDAADGTERYSSAIAELGGTFGSAFEEAALSMDQAGSAAEAASNALQGLLKDIERIILRLSVTDPITEGLVGLLKGVNWGDLFFGSGKNAAGFRMTGAGPGASANTSTSSGGLFGWLGSIFGFHGGGIAGGTPTFTRRMPMTAFAGAPRLHSGGFIGPGEVPAILKRGEGVFTADQMANLAPAGGGPAKVIINNNTGTAAEASASQEMGPDGQMQLVITLERQLSTRFRNGQGSLRKAVADTLGASPVAQVQRG